MRLVICFLTLCASVLSYSQQTTPSAPNPLDNLSFMKGDWTGKQNFETGGGPAMVGEATDRIDIGIAGKYLCEMLSTTLPGRKPTDTRHFISYDKQSGKYTAWWFNDTSTHPSELTGELTGKKLVLLSSSSGPGPVLRATYESPSDNTLTFLLEMKQGDSWTKLFLTTYSKKAATQP
ncbi:DUF1579 family protein [Telmatobacter sp. DSM 110680]|uniref:DUF1579 family protein n=1 Tax=Telmatobacter sp. DSM 110680 TaxID=3036704 RepID=A0AAU7DGS6_9BACT